MKKTFSLLLLFMLHIYVFTAFSVGEITLTELGNISTDGDGYDIVVDEAKHIAYVSCGYQGFRIINITDLTNPTLISHISEPSAVIAGIHSTGYAHQFSIKDKIAFVGDGSGGMTLINCTDVTSPSIITQYNGGYGWDVEIYEDIAYLGKGYMGMNAGIDVIDISNFSDPVKITSIPLSGDIVDLEIKNSRLYAVDNSNGLFIYDISNVTNPNLLASYEASLNYFMFVEVVNNVAWLGTWQDGIHIIDITDPSNITLLGTFDNSGEYFSIVVEDEFAFLADTEEGLKILDTSNISHVQEITRFYNDGGENRALVSNSIVYLIGEDTGFTILQMNKEEPTSTVITETTTITAETMTSNKPITSNNTESFSFSIFLGSLVTFILIKRRKK